MNDEGLNDEGLNDEGLNNEALNKDALKGDERQGNDRQGALLSLPKDGFCSADWSTRRRQEVKKAIDEHIRTVGDVDMRVVMIVV